MSRGTASSGESGKHSMRTLLVAALLCIASAHANYFSEGWKPGQPTPELPRATPVTVGAPASNEPAPKGGALLNRLLTSGPIASLMSRAGINASQALERALAENWDIRIPLIFDETYADLIVNEQLTAAEEAERVWFIMLTAGGGSKNAISTYVDQRFDEAYNLTLLADDLPHVRWARVNYMDVTYITTKWNVWKPPVIVVLKDRGKTLRFYYPATLDTRPESMHDFLKQEAWKPTPPWSGPWAPGGSREYILEFIAVWTAAIYRKLAKLPRFVLLLATGGLTSLMVNWLHRNDSSRVAAAVKPAAKPQPAHPADSASAALLAPPASPTAGKKGGGGAKKRKGGKN